MKHTLFTLIMLSVCSTSILVQANPTQPPRAPRLRPVTPDALTRTRLDQEDIQFLTNPNALNARQCAIRKALIKHLAQPSRIS